MPLKRTILSAFYFFSRLYSGKGEMVKSRRYVLIYNISAAITLYHSVGSFLVGLYTVLGVSDFWLGILAAIPPICNIGQIFSSFFLRNFQKKKHILAAMRIIYHLFSLVLIGMIPFLKIQGVIEKIVLLLVFTTISHFVSAILTPAMSALTIRSVPHEIRMDHFSVIVFLNMFSYSVFMLISGRITDFFRANGSFLTGLTIVRVFALVFATVDIFATFKMHEYEEPDNIKTRMPVYKYINKKFAVSTILVGCWTFFAYFPALYYNSFIVKDLGVSYSFLSLMNVTQLPCVLLTAPIWNKILKRISWYKSASCSIFIYAVSYIVASFTTASNFMIVLAMHCILVYCASSNVNTVMANMPFLNLPEEGRISCLGLYGAFTSAVGSLGVAAGSMFVSRMAGVSLNMFGEAYQVKQYILLVVGIGFIIVSGLFLLLRKYE